MILAIETSSPVAAAAIVPRDGAGVERSAPAGAQELHLLVDAVLGAASVTLGDIEAVAVDSGPGLFTGLRVGVVAAKCYAVALSVPLVACSSTDALLEGVAEEAAWAVVDMRRGQVAYARTGDVPVLADPGGCAAAIARARDAEGGIVVGDGAPRYTAQFAEAFRHRGVRVQMSHPSALAVGRLGLAALDSGRLADPDTLIPEYLRPADATANFRARTLEAGPP